MGWGAALGSAFGGILNFGSSMSQQQAENVRHSEQMAFARENMQMQKDFAQQGIRWKVDDARAARIHPLFAMGASTNPFTPVSVGSSGGGGSSPDYSSTFAQMGQGIERAMSAGKTNPERMEQLHEARHMQGLQFERAELENQFIRTQIARNMSQLGPAMPRLGQISPGGGNSGDVTTAQGTFEAKPPEITNPNPSNVGTEAGPSHPSVQWVQNSFGALQPYPAKNLKVEDEFAAPLMSRWLLTEAAPHNWRANNIPENVWRERFPGAIGVRWSYRNQGYVPVYSNETYKGDMFRSISRHGQGGVHPYSRYTPGIRSGLNSLR